AAHLLTDHFQRGRVREIASQKLLRAFHAFARDAFLPHTEKFRVFWREKKMRHELQCLPLIPEDLSCFCNGRLRQTSDHAALLHRHRTRRRDNVFFLVSKHNAANLLLEVSFIPHKLFLQMFPREFQRHELMTIVRTPRRRQRSIGDRVVPTVARNIIASRATFSAYCSVAIEIQTELKAVWMESASPVKRTLGPKVVPLDGYPDFVHVAVQGAPSIFDFTPGMLLGCATRIHFA